jgi:hypothetical protein
VKPESWLGVASVPERLDDWTYEAVQALAVAGANEGDRHDFKASLAGDRISQTSCSFANSQGGFLVFGVAEPEHAGGPWRIPGLAPDSEFASKFTQKLRTEPTLDWEGPRAVAIPGSANIVYVVEVRASRLKPHVPRQEPAVFLRRGKGTAIPMTHTEIRSQFIDTEERRIAVRMLALELMEGMRVFKILRVAPDPLAALVQFDPEVITRLMTEAYANIGADQQLMTELLNLRRNMAAFNTMKTQWTAAVLQHPKLLKAPDHSQAHGILNAMEDRFLNTLAALRDSHGADNVQPWVFNRS